MKSLENYSIKTFFQGWNRYAFYATITEGPCKNQKGVVKILKNKQLTWETK